MKQWILLSLVAAAIIFIIGVIFQILWIRAKISSYSASKLSSEMTQQAKISASTSSARSNLIVYSVALNTILTNSLNVEFNAEYIDLNSVAAPKSFNIPHTCGSIVKSVTLSCNDVGFLVLEMTMGSSALIQDLTNQSLLYIMVAGNLYLIDSNNTINQAIQKTYPQYKGYYIIYVYTISSSKNIILNTADTCQLDIVPFYGTLSTNNIINFLDLTSKHLHILGYYKSSV